MKVPRWFRRLRPAARRKSHACDSIATFLRSLLNECPLCGKDLVGHHYALLAHCIVPPESRAQSLDLLKMVKKQRWEEARKCREFDGAKDAVEAYVVRCTRGRLAVLYVHDPVEHARPPALLDWDAVAAESSRDLLSHIRENEWRLLDRRKSKR